MKNMICRIGMFLEKFGIGIILGFSLILGIGLSYYSLFYTETVSKETSASVTGRDNVVVNVLVFLAVFLLYGVFRKILRSDKAREFDLSIKLEKALLIFALIYSPAIGAIWVKLSHVIPSADAHSVCVVAECMLKGDYPMQPPTYMGYNPHQYGIVFALQILFALFGPGNYMAWQYMNCILFPLLIYAGYRTVKLIFDKCEISILYLLLMLGFCPLYFYLPYVYGDFPSVVCGMVIIWQMLVYLKEGKYRGLIAAILTAAVGCLVRKNTLIVVVAVFLILLVSSMKTARLRLAVLGLLMPVAVWGSDRGVALYYEHVSGQSISPGIPAVCYVMMGLEDTEEGPGWFNGSNYMAYARNEYDYDAAENYAKEQIDERIHELWNNKSYALDFFRRKILTQWNMPDYFSIHETMKFDCEPDELPALVHEIYYGEREDSLLHYMDRYQSLLYIGFLLSVAALIIKRKRSIEDYVLFVSVAGGLMFSVIWEAMSRYTLAYAVYMIPLSAAGICYVWEMIENRHRTNVQL